VEQLNIFSYILPQYKITKPIRLIELFAGIGSQAKALKNLGVNFEHHRVVEWDKCAVASYNAIHGTNFTTSDITKISGSDLGIVDTHLYDYILTYSFPCTDISLAGKMGGMSKGTNTRSGLLWEVERLLDECKELPQILLMENVPQIISQQNIADFQDWQYKLEQLGYLNYVSLLNAKDYGIPQNRNRCFMVSILGKYYYKFPHKQELKLRLKDMLEDEVDEKYYLSETAMRKSLPKVLVPYGSYYTWKNKQGNYNTQCNRAANPNNYALTVACGEVGKVLEDDLKIRKLTPKECWRLMGFSDEDFDKASKVNSNTQLYKQAGNSIVVNVLMAIFKELL
jgi:DNA (cytosine-5)-methyltransferase 1